MWAALQLGPLSMLINNANMPANGVIPFKNVHQKQSTVTQKHYGYTMDTSNGFASIIMNAN